MSDDDRDDATDTEPDDEAPEEEPQASDDKADEQPDTATEATDDEPSSADAEDTPEDGTTEEQDVAATAPEQDGLLARLMAFSAEDWLVVILLVALVGVAVASYVPMHTFLPGENPDAVERSTNPYCLETADAVEGNLSMQIRGEVSCTCLKPTNPDDPTLGDKANNTYTLQCQYPDGRKQNFEIWVPDEEFQNGTENMTPRVRQ